MYFDNPAGHAHYARGIYRSGNLSECARFVQQWISESGSGAIPVIREDPILSALIRDNLIQLPGTSLKELRDLISQKLLDASEDVVHSFHNFYFGLPVGEH